MAKAIQNQETRELLELQGGWTESVEDAVGSDAVRDVAIYSLDPDFRGNVDFVLFLSGNSAYRVDVFSAFD